MEPQYTPAPYQPAAYPPPPYPQAGYVPAPQPAPPRFQEKRRNLRTRGGRAALNKTSAIVIAQTVAGLLFQLPLMALMAVLGVDYLGDSMCYALFASVLSPLSTGLPALVYLLFAKPDWNDVLRFEKVGFFSALLWVFAGLALCLLGNYPAFLIEDLLTKFGATLPESPLGKGDSWVNLAVEFFGVAILVPFVEEFAFRGAIFSALERYGTGFAIAGSALIFGMAHLNIDSVVFATIAGLGMALVYAKTRNLWLTVAIHACNNGLSTLGGYVRLLGLGELLSNLVQSLMQLVPIALGVIAFIILLVRGHKRKQAQQAAPPNPEPPMPRPTLTAPLGKGETAVCLLTSPVMWGLFALVVLQTITLFLL